MPKAKKQESTQEESLAQMLVPESEQPYEVPGNWVWVRLRNAVSTCGDKFNDFENSEGVKYVGLEHLEKDAGVIGYSDASVVKSLKNIFSKGDLLYGKLRPYLNKHDIADFDGICSTDIVVFKALPQANIKLINYYFNTDRFLEYAISNSKGINLPRVSPDVILNAALPLPPLVEQQRIVERIESLFGKLDRAKELAQTAIDRCETHKVAILHKAFTGELTTKWREEHGVGLDSWENTKIGTVSKISSGGTPSRTNPHFYEGHIPWVKTGEITWNVITDTEEHITTDAIESSSAKIFPPNTVLVAMYGQGLTRGRAAILGVEAATNQAVCALIPKEALLYRYLYYYFERNYWDFREKAVGGNQPNFSGTMISKFPIQLPTLPEQQEIVRILDSLLEKEQRARELCDVIEKIDLMKKAILARAFRGELGTNDPMDESAARLLENVLSK